MHLSFLPLCTDDTLSLSRNGDVLTINGDVIDLSGIPDGATLPAEAIDNQWIVGCIERIDGMLHVTLRLPHGPMPSPAVAFPDPVTLTRNGTVTLPRDPEIEEADHGDD